MRTWAILIGAAAVGVGLGGCRAPERIDPAEARARAYPADAARGKGLDIQAFRVSTRLRLTNTTARSFGPSTVWLNQRFSAPVSALASGQSVEMELKEFVDEYGARFRAGGFFATQPPEPVVLVEIEEGGAAAMVGVRVVSNQMD
jgi:hypothetical protein